ncbi:MAG: hydrolase [Planctomycetota bacterium]
MAGASLLSAERAVLVVVDIQERLLPVISDGQEVAANTVRLIRGAKELGVPIVLTEQYPKGLGPTVPKVREAVEEARAASRKVAYVAKTAFGCTGDEAFVRALKELGRKQVVLCGIEAHICVLQTALGLIAEGYETFVAADAVGSRKMSHCILALKRLMQAGATLAVTESVLYEMLRDSGHPAFKAICRLVK